MSTREEVDGVFRHYLESVCSAVIAKCTIQRVCDKGEICPIINRLLPDLKKDLHSQGVVIKVEDWLPTRSGMTCTVEPLLSI